MQRISSIDAASAPPEAAELLGAVKEQMGAVPNIFGTMAQSPAVLGGFLGFAGALSTGVLSAALCEQIALAVAGTNRCDYCASAHTVLGAQNGLADEEIIRNLKGRASEPKVQAALSFAVQIVTQRGQLTDEDLAKVRSAGFTEEEIVELVANTLLNIFTNYFNHIADTEIDFPVVRTGEIAAA